jgi:deubiquitinase DESI2
MVIANRKYPKQVLLHVYDLSPINYFLHIMGLGIYHSGIEINGKEYTFAGGGGIFNTNPKEVIDSEGITLRETIVLGKTLKNRQEIDDILYSLRKNFDGNDYNLIKKNCNTFSDAFCLEILGEKIPAYVNRLANIGYIFEPLITKITNFFLQQQRSQQLNYTSSSNNSKNNNQKTSYIPFGGTGNKLN